MPNVNEPTNELVPEVQLVQPEKEEVKKELNALPITSISQLAMFQSGDPAVAPTHSPRKFYEQFVVKSNGVSLALWIWNQYNGTWYAIGLPSSGYTSASRAYLDTAKTIAKTTPVIVELDTENYDVDGEFNTTTHLFTATTTGYYQVNGKATWVTTEDSKQYVLYAYKTHSGTPSYYTVDIKESSGTGSLSCSLSDVIYLEAGDTLCLYVSHNGVGSADLWNAAGYTFLSIHRLS